MRTKPHGVKFTDSDWATLETIAAGQGVTVGTLIQRLCQQEAERMGKQWEGMLKQGRPKTKTS